MKTFDLKTQPLRQPPSAPWAVPCLLLALALVAVWQLWPAGDGGSPAPDNVDAAYTVPSFGP